MFDWLGLIYREKVTKWWGPISRLLFVSDIGLCSSFRVTSCCCWRSPPPPPPNGKLGGEKGRVVTDHHGNRCCQFRLLSLMWLSCLVNVFYLSTRVSASSLIYVRVTHKLCLAFPFRSVVCPSLLKATSKYPRVCVCLCGVDIVVHAERGSVRQIVF
jgi:hypothetical protein